MKKLFDDIREFHEKFGLTYDGKPRAVPGEMAEFRHKFQEEEATEYLLHNGYALIAKEEGDKADYTYRLGELLDAGIDGLYVLIGTMYLHGITFDMMEQGWERVHGKNMSKERATDAGQSKRGSTLDVIKPPGWEPPNHCDLVEVNDLE